MDDIRAVWLIRSQLFNSSTFFVKNASISTHRVKVLSIIILVKLSYGSEGVRVHYSLVAEAVAMVCIEESAILNIFTFLLLR